MAKLKYTIIKSKEQYRKYCNILEDLVIQEDSSLKDEIDLLSLLIEKWDKDHDTFGDLDPVELIKALMEEHDLKAKDLVNILGLSKATVSKILNYQKGLSKETIRRLADHFNISQEAFNRPDDLISSEKKVISKSMRCKKRDNLVFRG